jgi:hypothetical protein
MTDAAQWPNTPRIRRIVRNANARKRLARALGTLDNNTLAKRMARYTAKPYGAVKRGYQRPWLATIDRRWLIADIVDIEIPRDDRA